MNEEIWKSCREIAFFSAFSFFCLFAFLSGQNVQEIGVYLFCTLRRMGYVCIPVEVYARGRFGVSKRGDSRMSSFHSKKRSILNQIALYSNTLRPPQDS